MSSLQTRNSVIAVKEETTEGTPVSPTAATDYVAQRPGFDMTPEFEQLANDEFKSNIGTSKGTLGIETPTVTFPQYLRHSGTEGQAPNYGLFLKSLFGEEKILAEYDTVAGSTTTVINVDTGEGANFSKGDAVLVKNPSGFEIRHVDSVATDALTLNFALNNAPASLVNLGQSVNYKPKNDSHPSLTIWNYVSNGGAIQMASGVRATSGSFQATAGQNLEVNFDLEGNAFFFDPIEITATNKYVDWTDDDGTFAISLTERMYKDPHDVAEAIQTAMNASASTEVYTVTYNDIGTNKGKFTFDTATSTLFSLLWNTGTNAANSIKTTIGFDDADDTGATTYNSDNEIDLSAPQTPTYDDVGLLQGKNNELYIGDQDDNICVSANSVQIDVTNTKVNVESVCEESGVEGSIISERTVDITVSAKAEQYDADKFKRFRKNETTKLMYVFGSKSGGNWDAGKSGSIYVASATINSFDVTDENGVVYFEIGMQAFVPDDGSNEVFLGLV